MIDRQAALAALNAIVDPRSGKGLVEAGLAQGLSLREDRAGVMLEVPREAANLYAGVRDAAEAALAALPGVAKAQVVLTTDDAPAAPPPRRATLSPDPQAKPRPPVTAETPPHVRRVLAVASGKGGVGKSTVAVNLALAFSRQGLSVGLLDLDVYGPSVPTLLGVTKKPVFEEGMIQPILAHGLKAMSIGFLTDAGSANIWRGPMASNAVRQMIHGVAWGSEDAPLDILIVDLPPGTGDVQLTLVQKLTLDGAVIVSTPSELALADVRRAAAMFRETETTVLGLIENMAFFPDPATGAPIPIFGEGGVQREAAALGLPLLAQIPIDMALRAAGDAGAPLGGGASVAVFDGLALSLN